jgi:glycosyltransferase involved in cell wall biosynthesis
MIEVSVIITNHNYSKYLNRSIRSAFVQNFQVDKYEIIVVDDQSDDWSKEIINSYGKLIRPIFLDKNVGLAASRNIGIKAAVGKYILFLDADDYLNRDITFVGYIFLESNLDWDAVAFDYFLIDDDEVIIGRNSCSDMPIACGIMFRKEKLMEIGMYDESFKMHEDKDLQIRFIQKFIIHHIELPLYRYRHHNSNMTKDLILDKKYMKKLKDKHHLESEIY